MVMLSAAQSGWKEAAVLGSTAVVSATSTAQEGAHHRSEGCSVQSAAKITLRWVRRSGNSGTTRRKHWSGSAHRRAGDGAEAGG